MYSEEIINAIWQKAISVKGYNADMFRKDACGAWIMKDKYGKQHIFGWVIDHIYPKSLGGTDDMINLRPLQYQNNISKADDYPSYTSAVSSEGDINILHREKCSVNESIRKQLENLYKL